MELISSNKKSLIDYTKNNESLSERYVNKSRKILNIAKIRAVPKLLSNLEFCNDKLRRNLYLRKWFCYNIIVFICLKNSEHLLKKPISIFVYGTLNIRRKQFHQLFSVFVKSGNLYVLVVFLICF